MIIDVNDPIWKSCWNKILQAYTFNDYLRVQTGTEHLEAWLYETHNIKIIKNLEKRWEMVQLPIENEEDLTLFLLKWSKFDS
jgi:hypothetical protein